MLVRAHIRLLCVEDEIWTEEGAMRAIRDNGLTIVLLVLFGISVVGQWIAGWDVSLGDAARHHQVGLSLGAYTASPEFLSSIFENWESEFLNMSTYVVLTAILVQRGSAESKDPDAPRRDDDLTAQARKPDAPNILGWGPAWRALYARSLGLALTTLFIVSFAIHWTQSAKTAAQEAVEHGEVPLGALAYLGTGIARAFAQPIHPDARRD